jgi:hypothetical protein
VSSRKDDIAGVRHGVLTHRTKLCSSFMSTGTCQFSILWVVVDAKHGVLHGVLHWLCTRMACCESRSPSRRAYASHLFTHRCTFAHGLHELQALGGHASAYGRDLGKGSRRGGDRGNTDGEGFPPPPPGGVGVDGRGGDRDRSAGGGCGFGAGMSGGGSRDSGGNMGGGRDGVVMGGRGVGGSREGFNSNGMSAGGGHGSGGCLGDNRGGCDNSKGGGGRSARDSVWGDNAPIADGSVDRRRCQVVVLGLSFEYDAHGLVGMMQQCGAVLQARIPSDDSGKSKVCGVVGGVRTRVGWWCCCCVPTCDIRPLLCRAGASCCSEAPLAPPRQSNGGTGANTTAARWWSSSTRGFDIAGTSKRAHQRESSGVADEPGR